MNKRIFCILCTILVVLIQDVSIAQAPAGHSWLRSLNTLIGLVVGNLNPNFEDPRNRPPSPGSVTSSDVIWGTQPGNAGSRSPGSRTAPEGAVPTDPPSPHMEVRIREWISIAEPPENATLGAKLRYTLRGNKVGTVPGGIINSPHETGTFDPVYLWANKKSLDSVNHCTMEEYVLARVRNQDTGHCRGRYVEPQANPIDNFTGTPVGEARARLVQQGFRVTTKAGASAETKAKESIVASQNPMPGTRLKVGDTVQLVYFGKFDPSAGIPDLTGRTLEEAKDELHRRGLKPVFRPGTPAPTAAQSGTIESIRPAPGARVEPGAQVELTVHSNFVDARTIPDLIHASLENAKAALLQLGLVPEFRPGTPAPSRALSGVIEAQEPQPGEKVKVGRAVILIVHSNYIDATGVPDVSGLDAGEAKTRLASAGFSTRLQLGPPAPSAALTGTVAAQRPAAGVQARAGSEVEITVYSNFVAAVAVPSLQGLNASQAENTIRSAGLIPVRVDAGRPPSPDLADTVMAQSPKAGWQVKPGSSITLSVYGLNAPPPPPPPADLPPAMRPASACSCSVQSTAAGADPYCAVFEEGRGTGRVTFHLVNMSFLRPPDDTFKPPNDWLPRGMNECWVQEVEFQKTCRNFLESAECRAQAATFTIARVDHESHVINGGPGKNLSVTWSGNPAFPVIMIYQPRRGWDCSFGGCAAPQLVFQQQTNPLIFPGALYCRGYTAPDLYFDYEVLLVDANGLRTPAASAPFHCVKQPSSERPAVPVTQAGAGDFVGAYNLADPARSSDVYNGTMTLNPDGSFIAVEFGNGRQIDGKGWWAFDAAARVFTLQWEPNLGRFSGTVSGNTHDFVISGQWGNRKPGQLRIYR